MRGSAGGKLGEVGGGTPQKACGPRAGEPLVASLWPGVAVALRYSKLCYQVPLEVSLRLRGQGPLQLQLLRALGEDEAGRRGRGPLLCLRWSIGLGTHRAHAGSQIGGLESNSSVEP